MHPALHQQCKNPSKLKKITTGPQRLFFSINVLTKLTQAALLHPTKLTVFPRGPMILENNRSQLMECLLIELAS